MTTKVKAKWIDGSWRPVDKDGKPLKSFSNFRFVDESSADKAKRDAFTEKTQDTSATLDGEVD